MLLKICALGVRIRRAVSMHGIALNVETDLSYFDLIIPCGLEGRRVTSMRQRLADQTPAIAGVKTVLARHIERAIASEPTCDGLHGHVIR
jgi:lipoyl(octanoyl) transferase